jgi:hypothetical protein
MPVPFNPTQLSPNSLTKSSKTTTLGTKRKSRIINSFLTGILIISILKLLMKNMSDPSELELQEISQDTP